MKKNNPMDAFRQRGIDTQVVSQYIDHYGPVIAIELLKLESPNIQIQDESVCHCVNHLNRCLKAS